MSGHAPLKQGVKGDRTASLSAYFYDAEGHDREVKLSAKALADVGEKQLLWIDVERADTAGLQAIAALLKLPREALASIEAPPNPPELVNFEDHFQFSVPVPPKGSKPKPARVDFLISKRWLVTVRDIEIEVFARFRDRDKGETLTGRLSPAALAASLLDWHLQTYHDEVAAIAAAIDKMDEAVLESRVTRPPLSDLAAMRRRVSRLHTAIDAHGPIIYGLLRADFVAIAQSADVETYRALERRFERVEDGVEGVRGLVNSSFDLYATRTAQDTNHLVQMLTVITVIIGFCGAVAGIFGMNFDTPFSHAGLSGFIEVTLCMIVVSVGLAVVAKLRMWV